MGLVGIYHNRDLDGFTSGAIIKKRYPEAEMIGHDYTEEFDYEIKDSDIIMSDISLPIDEMVELGKNNKFFTWIDHHISAIKDFESLGNVSVIKPVLDTSISACEATWKHLYGKNIPLAVELLGKYDTWRHNGEKVWDEMILPFQYGMRLRCNSLETFPIEVFENEDLVYKIIEEGKSIIKYQNKQNEALCRNNSFEYEFNGLRSICVNGGSGSLTFDTVYNENKHDIMLTFSYTGSLWKFSLYTTKDSVDCSVIAKSYGGGGHKKAAGFEVKDIKKIIDI